MDRDAEHRKRIRRVYSDAPLLLLNLGILLASPLILLYKLRSFLQKRRAREFAPSRWFIPDPTPEQSAAHKKASGPKLVLVCASFGEAGIARLLARSIVQKRPDASVALSVCDPISLKSVLDAGWGLPVLPMPFDFIWPVLKWLNRARPDVLVFVESIPSKVLVAGAARYGAQVALANGRAPNRNRLRGRLLRPYYRRSINGIRTFLMQSEEQVRHILPFAPKGATICSLGNVKWDLHPQHLSEEKSGELESWVGQAGGKSFVVAGSTESDEEERFVTEAFGLVRAEIDCRLLLAPRNLKRIDACLDQLKTLGLTFSRRTESAGDADVFVLDTLGELSYAYRFGSAAYVGGFLDRKGHNVLEPLMSGVVFACGPEKSPFDALISQCAEAGIGARISTPTELAGFWIRWLQTTPDSHAVKERAEAIMKPHLGATERTSELLCLLLPSRASDPEH